MDIQSLRREGHSIKAICRMTGVSRNTVRRVLRQRVPVAFRAPRRISLLDSFKDYVKQRFSECQLSSVRLMEEVVPMGYRGSAVTLRMNLSIRMSLRRMTRLTNGHSKKIQNHVAALAIFFQFYNFARVHQSLRITPAMKAGVSDHIWEIEEILDLLN